MCTFIDCECLAVNALIELKNENIFRIGFRQLTDYGLSVVEQYKQVQEGDAVLVFSPDNIQKLVVNYFEFFGLEEEEEQRYICLKPESDIIKLKEQFRWTLSYPMLKALNRVNIMETIAKR